MNGQLVLGRELGLVAEVAEKGWPCLGEISRVGHGNAGCIAKNSASRSENTIEPCRTDGQQCAILQWLNAGRGQHAAPQGDLPATVHGPVPRPLQRLQSAVQETHLATSSVSEGLSLNLSN